VKDFERMREKLKQVYVSDYIELRNAVLASGGKVLHIATPDDSQRIYRYKIVNGGEKWKLAPMRTELEFLVLTGRLQSTRGGAWWWKASKEIRDHISRAPYRPRIDVIFSDALIDISKKTVSAPEYLYYDRDYNCAMILADDYWRVAVYLSPRSLVVSEREMRKELFNKCRSVIPILDKPVLVYQQGRLSMEVFPLKEREYKEMEKLIPIIEHHEGVMFYNHNIEALGYTRLDSEAIVLPKKEYEKYTVKEYEKYTVKIWSPSHVWEESGFLVIEEWSPFILRLTHPHPSPSNCVD